MRAFVALPLLRAATLAPFRRVADGRLAARPLAGVSDPLPAGVHTLPAPGARASVLVVPSNVSAGHPAPLVLMLHGATMDSTESLDAMREVCEHRGVVLLAPSSTGMTWDAIRGEFGPDLGEIDQQLAQVFAHCVIDPLRLAIAGFSDGASYAVSLGLINGDLFTHVIGYSAGFLIPGPRHGHPRVFMAHGTRDSILPIDRCGRRIAADLRADGYAVDFAEFDGDHEIRPEIVRRSMEWWLGTP